MEKVPKSRSAVRFASDAAAIAMPPKSLSRPRPAALKLDEKPVKISGQSREELIKSLRGSFKTLERYVGRRKPVFVGFPDIKYSGRSEDERF